VTKLYVTSAAAVSAFLVLVGALSATPVDAADTKTAAGPTGFGTESDHWIAPPAPSVGAIFPSRSLESVPWNHSRSVGKVQ
jgi:hypothetical protein